MQLISLEVDVKGEYIEASEPRRAIPIFAPFSAPQSFRPSPQNPTQWPTAYGTATDEKRLHKEVEPSTKVDLSGRSVSLAK